VLTARRRIVVLTEDSKPALGGIAEYLHQLARALSATHDVLIVSSIPGAGLVVGGQHVQYREMRWFRSHRRMPGDGFMPMRRLNTLAWRAVGPRHLRTALAAMAAEPADTTYVIGRLSVVTHPWCVAARALGIPYVAFAYGLELIDSMSPSAQRERAVDVRSAQHWFPISDDTMRLLDGFGVPRERQTMLAPGVDPATIAAPSEAVRRATRERYGLGADRFLLTICHLRARKGVDFSLRAFAAIAEEFPDVRYVVAGVGPEYDALRAMAGERVIFAGRVDDATRNALLAECEAFVMANRRLASDVEGFGIVFLEAALHGKATIGGRNGGVPDAVVDGVTGLLADTDDGPEDVARAMRELLGNPAAAARMGACGRTRALSDFSWPSRAAMFAQTVDELTVRQ
jgi:glycosyltransferase involved in cell wall biosynthesis